MDGAKIRASFLRYFESRGHTIVSSSPLVPRNDPSLFFTNSGMVQFKNTFTGEEKRDYSRATSVQKCLRVSGKHNDLENVGFTPRHHTFFEMLGNFSFGDYFKADAIHAAWDLLTNVYAIDGDKLWITVFREDDEAFSIWRDQEHIPERRIVRLDEKDNFWAMGDTGPCGPCSEIHIDKQAFAGRGLNPQPIDRDPEGYLEIWNLVFMQYERSPEGVLTALPRPSIDTGMGLERIASVLQGQQSNYDTDLFQPVIQRIAELCGIPYGLDEEKTTSMRVIADHARATAFLVCDGIMPSNEERGYVLRRIMRRAVRHGVKLGLREGFLEQAVSAVVHMMAGAYPELSDRHGFLSEVVRSEEEQFARTLDKGLKLYRDEAQALKRSGAPMLSGEFAFKLSDTFGFPLDLTEIIAGEDGLRVDHAGYAQELEQQRDMARRAWKGSGEATIDGIYQGIRSEGIGTEFVGYGQLHAEGYIRALIQRGARVDEAQAGNELELICDQSPFYAESGGQVGDTGHITRLTHHANGVEMTLSSSEDQTCAQPIQLEVTDTVRPVDGVIVHKGRLLAGSLRVGDRVLLEVDAARRNAIRRNHSATHLLHAALRNKLGAHVAQRGSLVAPDRLRFDFSHFKPLSPEELRAVEDEVNAASLQNILLEVSERPLQEAMAAGVMALFGEKYGDEVRVVQVPGVSAELCGGTHVDRTGDIGAFKLVSEAGIQAGVRRIEAVTGLNALELLRQQESRFASLAELLKVGVQEVPTRVQRLIDERRALEKQVEELKRKLARGAAGPSLEERTRLIAGVKVVAMALELDDPRALREEADRLRSTLVSAVVVLGARGENGSASLLVALTKDLVGKLHAGKLVQQLAPFVDGKGGGRPDLAQAGGSKAEGLEQALDAAYSLVEMALGAQPAA